MQRMDVVDAMVICIYEFLHNVHRPAYRVPKLTVPQTQYGRKHDEDGPEDDPPCAFRLAA
jgi:hypothetical protein